MVSNSSGITVQEIVKEHFDGKHGPGVFEIKSESLRAIVSGYGASLVSLEFGPHLKQLTLCNDIFDAAG
jgi:hypothetical protein